MLRLILLVITHYSSQTRSMRARLYSLEATGELQMLQRLQSKRVLNILKVEKNSGLDVLRT